MIIRFPVTKQSDNIGFQICASQYHAAFRIRMASVWSYMLIWSRCAQRRGKIKYGIRFAAQVSSYRFVNGIPDITCFSCHIKRRNGKQYYLTYGSLKSNNYCMKVIFNLLCCSAPQNIIYSEADVNCIAVFSRSSHPPFDAASYALA
jgi:hypothetical protein